jgi:hypothetical protein
MPATMAFFLPKYGRFSTLAQLLSGARGLMPTGQSSAELRGVDADIRMRSLFSARTTNAQYLQAISDGVGSLLAGDDNEATVRARMQDMLDLLAYDPTKGFPGDKEIPPAELGSLRDLSSERRVRLVLETQERQMANAGLAKAGNDGLRLRQFPAWEFVRIYQRKEERANWQERFVRAGGKLFAGRMIARKDAQVWEKLGSSDLFDDGLDTPYPPFAFNSGMGWREVPRGEAIALGVITPGEAPHPVDVEIAREVEVNRAQFDPEFLDALSAELKT